MTTLTKEMALEMVLEQGTDIVIPEGITHINNDAFSSYQLTSVVFPSSIKVIGSGAFKNNQLREIAIPAGVEYLTSNAFSGNLLSSVDLAYGVKTIGVEAFKDNNLTRIIIPESVSIIGRRAFQNNSLENIKIPEGIKELRYATFYGNDLVNVELPSSLTEIEPWTFASNLLESIDLPENISKIEDYAFKNNRLGKVVIPVNVVSIGHEAFYDNKISSLTLPDGIRGIVIGSRAFGSNELTSILIPKSVTKVEGFSDNHLTNIEIADGVKTIASYAFQGNKADYVFIPDSVKNIGQYAFSGDLSRASVSLDTDIQEGAFSRTTLIDRRELNQYPESLTISTSIIDENVREGSLVANISSLDPDIGDNSHTYELVAGSKDEDNGSFMVDGDQLKIRESPDFESKPSYSILLQAKDSGGLTLEKEFSLSVNDINEGPIGISASALSFDENIANQSPVATLISTDGDIGDSHTYAFVAGAGDIDNGSFKVDGDKLRILKSPDFESKSSYSIRLQTKDTGGLSLEKDFTLSVNDLNERPTSISISTLTFDENIDVGSLIAVLSSTDGDIDDSHTYALVTGSGDIDNGSFKVDGDELRILKSPDFESKPSYSILLQAKDSGGLTLEKEFSLSVNDINEGPIGISASALSFDENIANQSPVATLISTDGDIGDSHTYAFVAGAGDIDNGSFKVDGDKLRILKSPDFESKSSYSIRLQTKDTGGLSLEKDFTLSVNDLNERPTSISISTLTFDENIDVGSLIAVLSSTDGDIDDSHTYALVTGSGDIDNGSFKVDGDELRILKSPDFESKSSYSVRLKTEDTGGLTHEKSFKLKVNNLFEDMDGNGIVDGSKRIQIYQDKFNSIDLVNYSNGRKVLPNWNVLKAIQHDEGYQILVEGIKGKSDGKYTILSVDGGGRYSHKTDMSPWRTGEEVAWAGYEEDFQIDINGDSVIGITFEDSDNNGLVDESPILKLVDNDQAFDIVKGAKRRPQKQGSNWKAVKAIDVESGYQVLIEGVSAKLAGKFKVWSINSDGVIQDESAWKGGEQMVWEGYEEDFQIDINGDSVIGITFEDSDNNGLVDESPILKLVDNDQAFDIVKGAKRRPQKQGSNWKAVKAIDVESGYQVLIEGVSAKLAGKFKVWSIDSDGVIQDESAWKGGERMMWDGYEDVFALDINQDSVTGISFKDADGNGLVDNSALLRLANEDEAVTIVKGAKRIPQKNGSKWSALKAVETNSGYKLLLQKRQSKITGIFKIWSLDHDGLVQNSTAAKHESWMTRNGYDELFGVEFLSGAKVVFT